MGPSKNGHQPDEAQEAKGFTKSTADGHHHERARALDQRQQGHYQEPLCKGTAVVEATGNGPEPAMHATGDLVVTVTVVIVSQRHTDKCNIMP